MHNHSAVINFAWPKSMQKSINNRFADRKTPSIDYSGFVLLVPSLRKPLWTHEVCPPLCESTRRLHPVRRRTPENTENLGYTRPSCLPEARTLAYRTGARLQRPFSGSFFSVQLYCKIKICPEARMLGGNKNLIGIFDVREEEVVALFGVDGMAEVELDRIGSGGRGLGG